MLPVVVAGVTRSRFPCLELGVCFPGTMERDEAVRESGLLRGSEVVALGAWVALVAALGGGWSSAIAASAAFLFRVEGGVVKRGCGRMPAMGIRNRWEESGGCVTWKTERGRVVVGEGGESGEGAAIRRIRSLYTLAAIFQAPQLGVTRELGK